MIAFTRPPGGTATAAITLAPCPPARLDRLAHLRQLPCQYAADGAEMIRDDAAGISFHEIRRGDEIVGCFKLDPLYHERHDFARAFSIGLRGVLVDAGSQGTGIGRKAMGMLGGYVRARFPRAREVVLTVNHHNPGARAVYLAAGFRDDGEDFLGGARGPQRIMRLAL